jgi:hypothetical protein
MEKPAVALGEAIVFCEEGLSHFERAAGFVSGGVRVVVFGVLRLVRVGMTMRMGMSMRVIVGRSMMMSRPMLMLVFMLVLVVMGTVVFVLMSVFVLVMMSANSDRVFARQTASTISTHSVSPVCCVLAI